MERIITDNLDALIAICKRHHVKALWVFGSAAGVGIDGNRFGPESDVDLLVQFEKEYVSADPFGLFYLIDDLEAIFHRKVDVVERDAMRNPYFIEAVEQQKRLLYAA